MKKLFKLCFTGMGLLMSIEARCSEDHLQFLCKSLIKDGGYNQRHLVSIVSEGDEAAACKYREAWKLGANLAYKRAKSNKEVNEPFPNFPLILYGNPHEVTWNREEFCDRQIIPHKFVIDSGLPLILDSSQTTYKEVILIAAGWDAFAAKLNEYRGLHQHKSGFNYDYYDYYELTPKVLCCLGLGLIAIYNIYYTMSGGATDPHD
ncbi:MAG: hypothetical protein LBL32_03145 [Holosporales bacterium]|jgi:hypothetical protein|nr:hypothetical protein [Holosporales bacterium]